MRHAQASNIGRRHIPEDEPNFLKGWTLCLVDEEPESSEPGPAKVMVPFLLDGHDRIQVHARLAEAGKSLGFSCAFNWTSATAQRDLLWAEPLPPSGFAVIRFKNVATAHMAFEEDAPVRSIFESAVGSAAAYLVDERVIL